MSYDGWLESTKNQELRDSLNFRGVSTAGRSSLASQQGVRGAPIADASCVPGLELFKVSPFAGVGSLSGQPLSFNNSNDFMWASASNLDLSFMMWSRPYTGAPPASQGIGCGVMLRGDTATAIRPNDVFGAPVSDMVLVSGTFAWRLVFGIDITPASSVDEQRLLAGTTASDGTNSINTFRSSVPGLYLGTQFPVETPLPFAVYYMEDENTIAPGRSVLEDLMSANYAGFRIYDFTLATPSGSGWQFNRARMPQSSSGADTTSQTMDDPDNPGRQINNDAFWYLEDAVIAPFAERSISRDVRWNSDRRVNVGSSLTIPNVAGNAFDVSPASASLSVGVSPASTDLAGASYTWDPSTTRFVFTASAAGNYRVVFTGAITEEPGRRAEAVLNIEVT